MSATLWKSLPVWYWVVLGIADILLLVIIIYAAYNLIHDLKGDSR